MLLQTQQELGDAVSKSRETLPITLLTVSCLCPRQRLPAAAAFGAPRQPGTAIPRLSQMPLSICHGSWPCASSYLPFKICLHGAFAPLWWWLADTCNKAHFPYAPSHFGRILTKISLIVNVGMTVWQAIPVLCKKSYPYLQGLRGTLSQF